MNTQSNTQAGRFQIIAAVSLIGLEGRVGKMTHSGGSPRIALPTDVSDEADYLILEGSAADAHSTVEPIGREKPVRIRLKGTCNPGDKLTLAAIAGDDAGKVRTIPVDAGTYWSGYRAEEAGVDGQLVLCRLLPNPGPVVVPE